MRSLTEQVSKFVMELEYNDIPPEAISKAKLLLLDFLGYAVIGSLEPSSKIVAKLLIESGGRKESTIFTYEGKYPCFNAALANGVMAHSCELDDTHRRTMMHPGDSIIPSALAVAERENKNGEELLTAMIAAYEITIRIAEAVMPSHYIKWHPTGTINTFGAAVAAGKLINLNIEQMINALGIAGTQAAGLWTFLPEMAMCKDLNPGKAAMNGVLAALLARNGFTGGSGVLDHEKGFFKVYSNGTSNQKLLIDELCINYKLMEVAHKPYSACRYIHPVIDAILMIKEKYNVDQNKVKKINVEFPSVPFEKLEKVRSLNSYAVKFNVPFQVAITILEGKAGLSEMLKNPVKYAEEKLKSLEVLEIMKKVSVSINKSLDKDFPKLWPVIVTVETEKGKIFHQRIDLPKGEPENPMSKDEIITKFKALTSTILSYDNIEAIINKVLKIEDLSNIACVTDHLRIISVNKNIRASRK